MKNRHPHQRNDNQRREIQIDSVPKKRRAKSMKVKAKVFLILVFLGLGTLFYIGHSIIHITKDSDLPPIAKTSEISTEPLHPRYVTVVIPSVVNPNGRTKRLKAIEDTWGATANAIYVIHPGKEYTPTTTMTYPQTLLVPEEKATEEEGVPRLQYVIEQIYRNHNPDFAFFVNDHTYVIPQHACEFLKEKNPKEHLYAGHAMRPGDADFAFNSGASGYFLSRETMAFLTEKWSSGDDVCLGNNARNKKWLQGNPGLLTAQCLHSSLGLDPIDSRDRSRRHRFHAFGIVRVVKNEVDEWYRKRHIDLGGILGEDTVYNHELQEGVNCCSDKSISFHYVEWKETLALTKVFDTLRDNTNMDDETLRQTIELEWPTEKKDIGGYAHNLPPKKKKEVWVNLLEVIRNISPKNPRNVCF